MKLLDKAGRWPAILLLVLVSLLLAVAVFTLTRQPNYAGRSAGYWFRLYVRNPNCSPEPCEAFRAMGLEAVPYLTQRLSRGPSLAKSNMVSAVWAELAAQDYRNALLQQHAAAHLLGEIGPPARSSEAVLSTLTNSSFDLLGRSARAALIKIRREPIDWLCSALKDRGDVEAWYRNADLTFELGPYAASAVPAVMQALGDSNPVVHMQAMRALAVIAPQPSECVQAVVPFLTSQDVGRRQGAIAVLGWWGTNAAGAIEAIRHAQQDEDFVVRETAKRTLLKLSANAAAQESTSETADPGSAAKAAGSRR